MRHIDLIALLAAAALGAQAARAQIGLPEVQLPGVPSLPLPVDLDDTLSKVPGRLDAQRLLDLRQVRLSTLVRRHRDVLEADPNGAPILRSEALAFAPSAAALERARAAGFTIRRERTLEGLDATLVVLQAPDRMSTRRALKRLRALDPEGAYDFNHVYETTGELTLANGAEEEQAIGVAPAPSVTGPVGLIDGGVDASHPVFTNTRIQQRGCAGSPVASAHGTAVASLIAGRAERFSGAAPGAELHVVDVYCGTPTGGAADSIVDAFAAMARERVPVINVSLVGPPNRMLETVVRLVIARGHLVVAAVGNDGAAAPPLYPAAYPGVVAVTGVDARRRPLVEAGRGRHVDFAAPGADMSAATSASAYARVRGTSFAAPIVAGLLAAQIASPDRVAAEQALARLIKEAVDLGARGRDATFGDGLVGELIRN
ncbi:MAG: S8 family serine peptidase [Gammaproteobacteria bacterium]